MRVQVQVQVQAFSTCLTKATKTTKATPRRIGTCFFPTGRILINLSMQIGKDGTTPRLNRFLFGIFSGRYLDNTSTHASAHRASSVSLPLSYLQSCPTL